MQIKLFDQKNGKLVATKHLERMVVFGRVKDFYDDKWEEVLLWAHYMSYPYPDENPYISVSSYDRSEKIQSSLEMSTDVDLDDLAEEFMIHLKSLYSSPVSRSYDGMADLLDKMAKYISDTDVKDGRDGNMAQLTMYAKSYRQIRDSFKLAKADLEEEAKTESVGRGGLALAYDQK
jgi:hypothetical protein